MSNRHCTVMPDTRTTSGYSSFNDHGRQMFLVPLRRWQLGTAAICLPPCSQGIASFAFNSYNSFSFPPHPNLKQPLPWLSGIYNLSFICLKHSTPANSELRLTQQKVSSSPNTQPIITFCWLLPWFALESPTQSYTTWDDYYSPAQLWLVPCPWFLQYKPYRMFCILDFASSLWFIANLSLSLHTEQKPQAPFDSDASFPCRDAP